MIVEMSISEIREDPEKLVQEVAKGNVVAPTKHGKRLGLLGDATQSLEEKKQRRARALATIRRLSGGYVLEESYEDALDRKGE